jgi:hypothetical protein
MTKQKKPPIPISGVVYGEIIYWCTCVSALVVVFGTIKSFLEVDSTIPVDYLLSRVFDGYSVTALWTESALQRPPDALTYLAILNTGEAVTVAGISFGVLSVGPAIFFSAAYMWRSKNEFFAVTALLSGAFAIIAPFVFFLL